MGGCCCCFSKRVELNTSPRFYHVSNTLPSSILSPSSTKLLSYPSSSSKLQYPIASEERQPLSSNNGVPSALSTGLLVDTNLETSIPDTYRPPPAPIPYDVNVDRPRSPLNNLETSGVEEITNSNNSGESVIKEVKGSECKEVTNIELVETKEVDDEIEKSGELKKPTGPILPPEECPTCLEEYDEENPKIITKCEHHFHLSCILEWMERSDTCPVCDQEMIINFPVNE